MTDDAIRSSDRGVRGLDNSTKMNPGRSRGPMRMRLQVLPLGLVQLSQITLRSDLEQSGRAARMHCKCLN